MITVQNFTGRFPVRWRVYSALTMKTATRMGKNSATRKMKSMSEDGAGIAEAANERGVITGMAC